MNSDIVRSKNKTEDLLLSITKHCETLIEQIQRKAEGTLVSILSQPVQTFHFNSLIPIEGSWMIRLTSLEVFKSVFIITEKNNKFELYTNTFDEYFFEELKDEPEEIFSISDITPYHLQHEKIGPRITEAFEKLRTEKSSTDGCFTLLMGYVRFPFPDVASYLRIVVGLDEDVFQLILKQYNSFFINYELSPGIYTIKDISEAVYTMGDHEGTLQIEYDDITLKTNFILPRSGSTFGTLGLDEKVFLILYYDSRLLGLQTH